MISLQICILFILTIVVLHVSGPYKTFLVPDMVKEITTPLIISSLLHAVVEEYVFRHLFWSNIPRDIAVKYRITLVWCNTLLWWMAHISLVYHSIHTGTQSLLKIYLSTTYNLSLMYASLCLNAIYVECGPNSLLNCVLVHFLILLVWGIFLGGHKEEFYSKYNHPESLGSVKRLIKEYIQKNT